MFKSRKEKIKKKYKPKKDWRLQNINDHEILGLKTYIFVSHKTKHKIGRIRIINHYTEKQAWKCLTPPRW